MSQGLRTPAAKSAMAVLNCLAVLLLLAAPAGHAQESGWNPPLMEPELLAGLIEEGFDVPYVLYVGPGPLFDQGHITGSIYVGPASLEEGIEKLVESVKEIPKNASIVVYCGCCPWDVCPNVPPAYRKLVSMGFTNVQVLHIPTNLGADWISKGFPTSR